MKFRSLLHILLLVVSCLLQTIEALGGILQETRCNDAAPAIRFPFWVSSHRPEAYRSLPGFELFCDGNTTTIHFPAYGNLVVKSIDYSINKLDLLDPESCVHKVFLELDLSLTPFQYYYLVRNYTYLNCSAPLSPALEQVPCLSGSAHHVYTVDPGLRVPASCRAVRTVAIPLPYSSYLSDNSFGLGLTWNLTLDQKILKPKDGRTGFGEKQESKQPNASV